MDNDQLLHISFDEAIRCSDLNGLISHIEKFSPEELAYHVTRLSKNDQTLLMELLGPEKSAEIITTIAGRGVLNVMEHLPATQAATIVGEMSSRQQVDILRQMKNKDAVQILEDINLQHATEIRQLMSYPENTAGGLMIPEFLAYSEDMIVQDVLNDMSIHGEHYSDFDIQYAYVVTQEGMLLGVLRLRDLLMENKNKRIKDIMIRKPHRVKIDATLRDLREFFMQFNFLGVPVVDEGSKLVGVVRSSAVREAVNKHTNQVFLKFAGIVGGEEFRTMPLIKRSSRRLSWLSINIVLNIVAASIIALYQDTLEKAIVLAVFLPIISDMSGCSGNQAVAVSIRELTLNLVKPKEILRILGKEVGVGILNGVMLGLLLGGAAVLWKGNPYLGLVVGASLAANTLVAVCMGGSIPLVLRRMKTDPALASGPLLTTITDMCGFFFLLSFASAILPNLTPTLHKI